MYLKAKTTSSTVSNNYCVLFIIHFYFYLCLSLSAFYFILTETDVIVCFGQIYEVREYICWSNTN